MGVRIRDQASLPAAAGLRSTRAGCWILSLLLFYLMMTAVVFAGSRQLPLRSINYMSFYTKQEFDERFPGKVITDKHPSDEGYYVVYQHENLLYYFGPDMYESIAEIYKEELDRVVEIVKGKRESLKTAKTYILKLPRDKASAPSASESTSEETAKSGAPKPPEPESWWSRLFRKIGF